MLCCVHIFSSHRNNFLCFFFKNKILRKIGIIVNRKSVIINNLNKNIIDIIRENKSEYALGLQGPDVLFFYKPYTGTYISKTGSLIHQKAGKFFFEKGKMSYEKYKDESLLAYLIGCVCHYCFDKNAHPFVDEKAPVSKLHHKLEAEFDMYISNISQNGTQNLSLLKSGLIT